MDSPARANAYGNTGMETEVRQLKVRRERDATRRDATRHDDDDRDEDVEIKIEIKSIARTDAETSPTRVRAGSSTNARRVAQSRARAEDRTSGLAV